MDIFRATEIAYKNGYQAAVNEVTLILKNNKENPEALIKELEKMISGANPRGVSHA